LDFNLILLGGLSAVCIGLLITLYFFNKNNNIVNQELKIIREQKEQLNIAYLTTKQQLIDKNNHTNELKNEFKNLATDILDNNSKKFTEQNKENIGFILNPMKQQLNDFKKKVEDVYDKESKDRSALQQELKSLKELNQKISTDAINLTNALKGENKTQGIWGEMILEKVLENSGLREGMEYIREESLQNNDGKRYRPDVIVNLPENRHIIIDAKTSLTAYEQYISSIESEDQKRFLNNHSISINQHINELSDKKYEELKGINSLDFIFMFVPIESALMLALENDKSLFDKAFKKKIVLVSPTTLLVALKAIENSWKYEKQAQNTTEVIRLAEKLYGKVKSFVDDFDKVGKNILLAQKSYDEAYGKLSQGRDNIIRQIEVFKNKSSINPSKKLSQDMIDVAMSQIEK
jgi:DNA recombination protein RmuC